MKHVGILIPVIITLLLSACQTFEEKKGPPTLNQIDTWVINEQFGRAFDALDSISPKEKRYSEYVKKREDITEIADKYEQKILNDSKQKIKQGKWADAIAALSLSLKNYPGGIKLRKHYNALIKQQQKRINKLDAKALLARAQLLYNKLPISETRAERSPIDFSTHWKLQGMRTELADMHKRLLSMARQLIRDNEYTLSEQCLHQARLLAGDDISLKEIAIQQAKIDEYNKQQDELKQKRKAQETLQKQQAKKRGYIKRVSSLLGSVRTALKNNDLVTARKKLSVLSRLTPNNIEYLQLRLQHRDSVERIVQKMIQQGNNLYRQEKIIQARDVWQKALELDPFNKTLQTQIRRATRVLDKLDALRKNQKAEKE